jgi:predicted negative regulator of RcsB-dependent stress response
MNTKGLEDFFVDNWKAVAGAIAAVVVLIAGYAIWNEMHQAREARATDALYDAQKIARAAAEQKKIPEADAALQKVSTEFSGTRAAFEASLQAGDLYMDAGTYPQAVERYDQAAKAAKDAFSRILARYNLGIAKESAGQFQEAVAAYDDALNTNGSDFLKPEIMMAQARCYEALNQAPKALSIYQEVQKNYAGNTYYSGAAAGFASKLGAAPVAAQ